MAVDIGQAVVAALKTMGQTFVIDAQQMQHRGVKVEVYCRKWRNDIKPQSLVSIAIPVARTQP